MASRRKLYWKRGRAYGDFREFIEFGGGQEALIPPNETQATADRRLAETLYDKRLSEFLNKKLAAHPIEVAVQDPHTLTLKRCVELWITAYEGLVDFGVTRDRHRHLRIASTLLRPNTPVRELTPGLVIEFLSKLRELPRGHFRHLLGEPHGRHDEQPYSSNTRRKILDTLQMSLDHAVAHRLLEQNPARNLPRLVVPKMQTERETQFYTPEEAGLILSALIPSEDWPDKTCPYVFEQVAFALMTGARRNEMQSQRWEWIDWDRGLIRIYTSKKQRGEQRGKILAKTLRTVLLWPQLREILRDAWMRRGQPATGLLWPQLRRPTRERLHVPAVERGALSKKSIYNLLRLRGLITGGPGTKQSLQFLGREGYQASWREFRITYCAVRLQTVEPVAGKQGEWTPVARRTVELEMGHASADMVDQVYGRVVEGPQLRVPAVAYPIKPFGCLTEQERKRLFRVA